MTAHRESLSTLCPSQQQARELPRAVHHSLGFLCPPLVAEFVPEVTIQQLGGCTQVSLPRGLRPIMKGRNGYCLLTFCLNDHNFLLQINWGIYKTQPRLLLLSHADSVLVYNHPVSVIQQTLVSYWPFCNLGKHHDKNISPINRFTLKRKESEKKPLMKYFEIRKTCVSQCRPLIRETLIANQR